ncbi:glutamate receptor 2.3-like [Salvia hispanica]|uniref:glutamate receptor 2.3-like n=1 Tax=Salvia hispanica TaxID=49212 RepID=UPI002009672C|nr:glutamate receptor 2.3-like [Salvia hispanica]
MLMEIPRFCCIFTLIFMSFCVVQLNCRNATAVKADIGAILDLHTTLGKICRSCISMAIEDFYSNRDHTAMIVPHFRDSGTDAFAAASAAIELLKNTQVMAILGPQRSVQADFVIDIGDKVRVPVISPPMSPILSSKESHTSFG